MIGLTVLELRTPWDISLMAIRNNVTEIVDPWDTPFSCMKGSDRELGVITCKVRLQRKLFMNASFGQNLVEFIINNSWPPSCVVCLGNFKTENS